MLISFEGIDGCGKSTQITLLQQKLRREGFPVEVLREPGGTELSEMIRGLLLNPDIQISDVTELLLFSSARSELVVQKIIPYLNNNIIVLLDRFYDSTIAYQGFGRGTMPIDQIHSLNATASHGITPNITFLLDIDINGAYKRRANQLEDRMEKSGQAFYERVRDGYHFLAKNNERFVTLDAQLPPEDIHFAIWKRVSACL